MSDHAPPLRPDFESTSSVRSARYEALLESRRQLPVFPHRDVVIRTLRHHQVLVLVGETGSGKTTQVPQFLVEAGYRRVACTQPRRIAAVNVAKRVAEEMDVQLGAEVGYTIRFEDVSHPKRTRLKYVTDGMLLREAYGDPSLTQYDCILLDEAHERTLNTDVLMGLLKSVLPRRPELRLVVMSATLESGKFTDYFDHAPLVNVSGRMYPVHIEYVSQPVRDYLLAAEEAVMRIHRDEPPGDILLFLTGAEEIDSVCDRLRWRVRTERDSRSTAALAPLLVLPLYSALPPPKQQLVFEPPPPDGTRKVIVATNVAETSITIDGIVYVVDPGFVKSKIFNPRSRVESLLVSAISKASAQQRAGRAGRTRPGTCYRLYTEASFQQELAEATHPEILRSNLATVVLTLKKLQVHDLVHFDFMDPPPPETFMRALEMLYYLRALDDDGNLTQLGSRMADLPLDPPLSKMLLESERFRCSDEATKLAAMLSTQIVFLRPRNKQAEADAAKLRLMNEAGGSGAGDHALLVQVFEAYLRHGQSARWCYEHFLNDRALRHAMHIQQQLARMLHRLQVPLISPGVRAPDRWLRLRQCVLQGYFMQVAFWRRGKSYTIVRDEQTVFLHPSTVVQHRPAWVVFHEFVLTTRNYIRIMSEVRPEWLLQLAPHYFDEREYADGASRQALQRLGRYRASK